MAIEELTQAGDVDAVIAADEAVWIFKHSKVCGISFAAKEQVDRYLEQHPDERLAMVVIQDHRDVSNHIAEALGRVHQSPQLFLVRAGEVLWHASHYSITADAMAKARDEATG